MDDLKGMRENRETASAADGRVRLCQSCDRLGRCRLGLTDERLVEETVSVTKLKCGSEHEGGPGVAHGGWIAAAFDEILGHLVLLCDSMAVTAVLKVEFLKPAPIERDLEVRAWRERLEGNRWRNAGELRLVSTGALLARASGVFVERDRSHFDKHARWLADQDRLAGDGSNETIAGREKAEPETSR